MVNILSKAFQTAPMGTLGVAMAGFEYAPKFTTSLAVALGANALMNWATQRETEQTMSERIELMSKIGPWQYGPLVAERSRNILEALPNDDLRVTLLDPYYFNHRMVYTDDSYGEGDMSMFTYAYRLRPCGVFALNYDPRQDKPNPLTESVFCVAYLRGTDIGGRSLLFTAMWLEGLPLGDKCAFEIPEWGQLRLADEDESQKFVWDQFTKLYEDARVSGTPEDRLIQARDLMSEIKALPTPVERGFPHLGTPWAGTEPFPLLEDFEHQLIGADFIHRGISVPLWFRPGRGELG